MAQQPQAPGQQRPKGFTSSIPTPTKLPTGAGRKEWERFRRTFANYSKATRLENEANELKTAVFLACMGEDNAELLEGFDFADGEDKENLTHVTQKYEQFFVGETNEVYEAFIFHHRNQDDDENIDSYVQSLRKLAKTCGFGDQEDRMLRDKMVLGIKDVRSREKLLEVRGLTLKLAVEMCKAAEAAQIQTKDIANPKQEQEATVHKVSQHKGHSHKEKASRQTNHKCIKCGKTHEKRNCPAFGKTCYKCGYKNHFATHCKSKKKVHAMQEHDTDTEEEEEDLYVSALSSTN
ncbi:hypothetical protein V1264_005395 [Littorina saxatilis]|uniref:CCHC-type domain-containing protein n=1 Tax=Littorina saxatilis TaxID=31220 RepID=A0AAN9G620_9CAEN